MLSYDLPPPDISAVSRETILVVEDEVLVRLVLCDALRDAGYDVIEACDGNEAVSVLQSALHFDLILTDVQMPGPLDGLGLLRYVRAEKPELPVIVMSAHLERSGALSAGANEFLSKPFGNQVILDTISALLLKAARHDG